MSEISLKNIQKSFGSKTILKNFSLEVKKNDYVALVGPSGSGKTTLLNIIGLLEKPDSGIVMIGGVENPRFDQKSGRKILREQISYMFQNYGLVERMTVIENLRIVTRFLGLQSKDEKVKISETLSRVGLEGMESAKIYQLSGGEQQRVAVAKIMLKPCNIILADEPTGSLDAKNRDHILRLLSELHREGKTIVIVTHDPVVEKCANTRIKLS